MKGLYTVVWAEAIESTAMHDDTKRTAWDLTARTAALPVERVRVGPGEFVDSIPAEVADLVERGWLAVANGRYIPTRATS